MRPDHGSTITKPIKLVLDLFMGCLFFFIPHFGFMPIYAYPVVLLFVLWGYLRLNHQNFSDIGFQFSTLSLRSLLVGGTLGTVYFFLVFFFIGPVTTWLFHLPVADVSDFYFVKSSLNGYIFILLVAWVFAIPFEEIIFRGYIFTVIQSLLTARGNFTISTIITSIIFGLYHMQQGAGGIINAFIFGLVITILLGVFKNNLWYLIFFHCMYDTCALTAMRWGYLT